MVGGAFWPARSLVLSPRAFGGAACGARGVAWLWWAVTRPAVRFVRIFIGVLPRGSRATSLRIRRYLRLPRSDGGLDLEGALQVAREEGERLGLWALARVRVLVLQGLLP